MMTPPPCLPRQIPLNSIRLLLYLRLRLGRVLDTRSPVALDRNGLNLGLLLCGEVRSFGEGGGRSGVGWVSSRVPLVSSTA